MGSSSRLAGRAGSEDTAETSESVAALRTALHRLADRDPVQLACLVILGGAYLVEERLAEARHTQAEQSKAAAVAIAGVLDWTAASRRPSHRELMRRRYPPSGDPDLWVRYGPTGPPEGAAA